MSRCDACLYQFDDTEFWWLDEGEGQTVENGCNCVVILTTAFCDHCDDTLRQIRQIPNQILRMSQSNLKVQIFDVSVEVERV